MSRVLYFRIEQLEQENKKLRNSLKELRDEFAMAALIGIVSIPVPAATTAKMAYEIADAMMEARDAMMEARTEVLDKADK